MKAVKLIFKEKRENSVVLNTEDSEDIIIPSKYIPSEVKEGSTLYLKIQKKLTDDPKNQKDLAKAVLEEILNNGE